MRLSRSEFMKAIGGGAIISKLASADVASVVSDETGLPIVSTREHSRVGQYDVVDGVLYDRVVLRKGDSLDSLKTFNYPIGSVDITGYRKTETDTNMWAAQMLQPPSSFLVRRIGFVSSQKLPERLLADAHWRLWLDQKSFASGPISWNSSIGELKISMEDGPDRWSIASRAKLTLPDMQDRLFRNVSALGGIHIMALQQFNVSLHCPNACEAEKDLSFYVVLAGLEWRGVQ